MKCISLKVGPKWALSSIRVFVILLYVLCRMNVLCVIAFRPIKFGTAAMFKLNICLVFCPGPCWAQQSELMLKGCISAINL